MKNTTALLMALGLALPAMTFAQDAEKPRQPRGDRPPQREGAPGDADRPGQNREGGPGAPGGPRGQMVAPLFAALDVNKDGVLDADEIKNAAAALAKLDKDGDGKITQEEMRPPRPAGDRPNLGEDGREGQGPRGQRGPGGEGQRPAASRRRSAAAVSKPVQNKDRTTRLESLATCRHEGRRYDVTPAFQSAGREVFQPPVPIRATQST